jgi:putative transport protein
MFGRRQALVAADNPLRAYETLDDELLDLGLVSRDVVVTSDKAGRTLGELAENEASRGVFLEKFLRMGKELPVTFQTPIQPGDVLSVKGEPSNIDRVVSEVGYAITPTDATNMTVVSTAIFLGALIGLPRLVFRGIEVSLTLFVGVLIGGLVLGWLSSSHPRIGRIPEAALWLFDSLGLTGFLALVGLEAGPEFLSGWQQAGFALLASAVVIVVVTNVVGILFGRYILRMHPGLVLGACAGAVTSAPALGALLESAESRIPALSYGVGYALGNVVLAIGGAVIVTILAPK